MMKFRNLLAAAAAVLMAGILSVPVFAAQSYTDWYQEKFGVTPDGTVYDWEYDPVYYQYLDETGQRDGYVYHSADANQDAVGDTSSDKKTYADITDTSWSGKTAKWTLDGYASKYQVRLYRDGDRITTKEVTAKRYNFSSYITRKGDYSFEVRPYNSKAGGWQDWEWSEEKYFSASDTSSGSSSSSSSSSYGPSAGAQWIQAQDGTGRWWYRHSDGSYTASNWELINGKWYFFDGSGWMMTGWLPLTGGTYFLGPDGAMVTGNFMVDGVTHNFDSTGRMVF